MEHLNSDNKSWPSGIVVVMGTWRVVWTESGQRIWGPNERERPVDFIAAVQGTDMLVMRLHEDMPLTNYINYACFPFDVLSVPNIVPGMRCAVSGPASDRLNIPFDLMVVENCTNGHMCVKPLIDDTPCMHEWSGLIVCQIEEGINPTWLAMGIWTFTKQQTPDCSFITQHQALTETVITEVNIAMKKSELENIQVLECSGVDCATGMCLPESAFCDGHLHCPDQKDEPLYCPPVVMCHLNQATGSCDCPEDEIPCSDGLCIQKEAVCDGVNHCLDGSDEPEQCTCAKRLELIRPDSLCDGKLDCPDYSDEANCKTPVCDQSTHFRCHGSSSKECISISSVCDGVADCELAEDEEECLALSHSLNIPQSVDGHIVGNSDGILMVRVMGKWFTYDYEMWKEELCDKVCHKFSYQSCNSTQPVSTDVMTYSDDRRSFGDDWLSFFYPVSNEESDASTTPAAILYVIKPYEKVNSLVFVKCNFY